MFDLFPFPLFRGLCGRTSNGRINPPCLSNSGCLCCNFNRPLPSTSACTSSLTCLPPVQLHWNRELKLWIWLNICPICLTVVEFDEMLLAIWLNSPVICFLFAWICFNAAWVMSICFEFGSMLLDYYAQIAFGDSSWVCLEWDVQSCWQNLNLCKF